MKEVVVSFQRKYFESGSDSRVARHLPRWSDGRYNVSTQWNVLLKRPTSLAKRFGGACLLIARSRQGRFLDLRFVLDRNDDSLTEQLQCAFYALKLGSVIGVKESTYFLLVTS